MRTSPAHQVAHTTLSVNGDDRTVALTLQPGMTMSGRFVFEGTTAPGAMPGARVLIEDLRIQDSGGISTYTAEAAADGTFRIADILPGQFKLSNESRPGLALTSGWALKSIAAGGRDLLDAPFELRPNESLSDIVGHVHGSSKRTHRYAAEPIGHAGIRLLHCGLRGRSAVLVPELSTDHVRALEYERRLHGAQPSCGRVFRRGADGR
jgi:hypothetical protein